MVQTQGHSEPGAKSGTQRGTPRYRRQARASRQAARRAAKRRAAADARSLREARGRRRNRPRREPIPPGLYPEKFTQHRIRIVSMLREWQSRRVQPDEAETYPVTRLIGEAARRELRPVELPAFFLETERRARLLGLVVLACLKRGAPAVRGSHAFAWSRYQGMKSSFPCAARSGPGAHPSAPE